MGEKKMKTLYAICLFIFLVSFYGLSLAQELEGTWIGQEDTGEPFTFIFTGNDWSSNNSDSSEWYNGTASSNPNTDPKELDLLVEDCFSAGYIGNTSLAIYKIEAGVLTLTISEPGLTYRPVSFGESGNPRTYTGSLQGSNDDPDDDGGGGGGGGGGGCFLGVLKL
jgi:uncharacterized protein (TIGR03067 family)